MLTPDNDSPDSPIPLVHARKLRGLRRGFCISPMNERGEISGIARRDHAKEFPQAEQCVLTGRSGNCFAIQFTTPPVGLPATWIVRRSGLEIHLFGMPLETVADDLRPALDIPTSFGVATVLRLAPLPGCLNTESGERYEWGAVNPWTRDKPAPMPLDLWRQLPKQKAFTPSFGDKGRFLTH